MSKVILHVTLSLDGFMAGPHDEMDWMFAYDGGDMRIAKEVMQTTGAVVLGRRTYEVSVANGHMPYGASVKVPQFVVTPKAQDPQEHQGLTFTFVTDGLEKAVELARTAAGDKNVSLLGANIDQQCLKAGLVDEIVIHLVPILLGDGIRLFDRLGTTPIKLKKLQAVDSGELTDLRFAVIK